MFNVQFNTSLVLLQVLLQITVALQNRVTEIWTQGLNWEFLCSFFFPQVLRRLNVDCHWEPGLRLLLALPLLVYCFLTQIPKITFCIMWILDTKKCKSRKVKFYCQLSLSLLFRNSIRRDFCQELIDRMSLLAKLVASNLVVLLTKWVLCIKAMLC